VGPSYYAAVGPLPQSTVATAALGATHQAVLKQYCIGCHNDQLKSAGLALSAVDVQDVSKNLEVWEKVVRKLRARAMPPSGRPRPDEGTYNAFVSYLETSLDREMAARPNPGRIDTARRLNRTEYQNAIRDLLGLEVDVASLLPGDDSSHGFDNITVGELSPTLMERYLSAAQKISRLAVGTPVRSPGSITIVLPADLTQEDHLNGLPVGTRGGTVVQQTFPLDGEYELQIRLSRDRNERIEGLTEPHDMEFTLDGERVKLLRVEPVRGNAQDSYNKGEEAQGAFTVRFSAKAGPHAIGVGFLRRSSTLLETERQPYQAHFNADRHPRTQPSVYSLALTGPFNASGPGDTPSRRRIFVCRPSKPSEEASCARTILSTLARRAYRRPVTDTDLQAPLSFYKDRRAEDGFEAGIETALRSILVAPEFLFRIEAEPTNVASNTPYRISDLELASRVSFFLWSSIPDDELLDLATRGKLKDPAVLEQQVRRMLADTRSSMLVSNFGGQWLHLRNLASFAPDPRTFPDFDDNLRQAFRRETELFFQSIVNEDRSVLDLLKADYTFVNERLAKHYGIPNVYGSRFRRITFDTDSPRGGLLGQGSILAVSSYATRTSPVLRGKWILDNILGTPPPPPPPNVPPLKTDNPEGKILTMRDRMAAHRANPACASCHQIMDPVGFSLENYDAIGRWRTDETGTPIDASGNLPDGVKFEGASGLRKALLSRPELFVTTMTEKLLTYGLGRGLEFYDAAAVRKIVRDAHSKDDRFSSLILGIVNSTPFQMRRSQ
jgi:mono/diheme cytochrome c family protein